MRRLLRSREFTAARRNSVLAGRRAPSDQLFPWSTSDGVEVAGQPARCLSLPLVSCVDLRVVPGALHNPPVRVTIRVRPGAGRTVVGGEHDGALVVRVAARAVDGKASEAALAAVAEAVGLRRRQ